MKCTNHPFRIIELERDMSGNCVCCYSSFFWIAVVALLVSIQIIHYILGAIFGALHLSRVYKWIAKGFQALSAILVLLLAVWANSPPLQNYAFSKLAVTILLKDQPLDQVRCDHFKHLSGRVLEIGPGPGKSDNILLVSSLNLTLNHRN